MIIKLNVGGHVFITTQQTLTGDGDNMLSIMIQHENPAQLIDGHYFIDRDPDTFRWILRYLRGSKTLPPSDSVDILLLREEADYFSLGPLLSRIRHIISPNFEPSDRVLVRGHKFTIIEVTEHGYTMTRLGQCFEIDSSEIVESSCIEIGDGVMAFDKGKQKRMPGICMGIIGKNCIVQFESDRCHKTCLQSGIRF